MTDAPVPSKAKGLIGDVNKKLGPFPVWVWGVAGTAGFLGYQWWVNRTSEPTTQTTTTTDPTTGEQTVAQRHGMRRVPRGERQQRRRDNGQHHRNGGKQTHRGPIMKPGEHNVAENQEVITEPASNNYAQRPPVSSTFGIEHVSDPDIDSIINRNGQPFQRLNSRSAIGGYASDVD